MFLDQLKIIPSIVNQRIGTLEAVLTLPPKQQLIVFYEFRKLLQHWNAFPPDANHGFYLPHAVVSYQLTQDQQYLVQRSKYLSYSDLVLPHLINTYDNLL